ncbi:MAG: ankyrin repeat domain-containing protein, partial [Gammaproteobacteria bacterium]|nr:ankyrin repeat domain-containing protein [Gammaproteobacteria bacterium]
MQTKIQEPAIVQNEASVLKDDEKKITTLPYSCYFEVQLDEKDFGKRREEHFRICNEQLVIQLVELEKDGMQLCSEVSNAFLIDTIRKCKTQPPGKDLFTWEHCSSLTANGRLGVMRLVSASQHKKHSKHWLSLHPDKHGRGGYHEWAIPAGAPANNKSPIPKDVNIKKITLEQLPQYFEIAVSANRFDQFSEVLIRAKEICTPRKRGIMLTQCYPMGKSKKLNTLLHVAVKNGYKPMIEEILGCGAKIEDILLIQNYTGNTIAHIAAENNRHNILRDLKALGADLTIRNKRKETVADIVHTRKYTACIPVLLASTNPDNSHNEEGGKKCVTPPDRDPHFAYGTNSKNGAAHQKSGAQSTFHAPVKNSTPLNRAAPVSNKSYVETLKDIIKKRTDSTKATNSNNHNQAPKNTFQKIVRDNKQNGTLILPGKTQTNALSTIFKYKEAFIESLSKQSRQRLKLNQQKLHETQSRTQQDARKQAKQQNQQRVHKQVQQTTQQTAHKQSQQQTQQQNQQRAQQHAQRAQQQNLQRAQQQAQRAQQQNLQHAQQQAQRAQQQNLQRAQQQAQRAQQQ